MLIQDDLVSDAISYFQKILPIAVLAIVILFLVMVSFFCCFSFFYHFKTYNQARSTFYASKIHQKSYEGNLQNSQICHYGIFLALKIISYSSFARFNSNFFHLSSFSLFTTRLIMGYVLLLEFWFCCSLALFNQSILLKELMERNNSGLTKLLFSFFL